MDKLQINVTRTTNQKRIKQTNEKKKEKLNLGNYEFTKKIANYLQSKNSGKYIYKESMIHFIKSKTTTQTKGKLVVQHNMNTKLKITKLYSY